ncbi:MAG: hypothetical protein ACRD3T_09680, partial [Terriglobia bacterium]
ADSRLTPGPVTIRLTLAERSMRSLARVLVMVMMLALLSPALECAGPPPPRPMAMNCCKAMNNACRAHQSEGQWDCCQHTVSRSGTGSLTLPPAPVDGRSSLARVPVFAVTAQALALATCTDHLMVSRPHPPPRVPLFVVQRVFRI